MKNFNKKNVTLTHKAGDALERLGEILSKVGATRIGQAVYNAGNKLEHKNEKSVRSAVGGNVSTDI